jgi:hypothetical protein
VGQAFVVRVRVVPPKKSSSKKSSASSFRNLTLQSREARGAAQNQWTALAAVHQKNSKTDLVSTMVLVYTSALTYFSRNC